MSLKSHGLLVLALVFLPSCFGLLSGGKNAEGTEPGECTDGADNDGDGDFDCDDDGCLGSPDCDENTTETAPISTATATGSVTDTGSNPGTDRFQEFIYVDQAGVEATGDFTGLPEGADWETIPWLTQETIAAEDIVATGFVEDLESEDGVPEALVELWLDNMVDASADESATSGLAGDITIPAVSCQPMTYRVTTDPLVTETKVTYEAHYIFQPVASGASEGAVFTSVSDVTYRLIPSLLGVSVDPDKAIILGTAYDILRDPATVSDINGGKIEGAQVIVYDENGNIPDTLEVHYFIDSFPNRDQEWTSDDGLWLAANVPAGVLRVEMWGVVAGELKLLGATLLQSEPDVINISNIFAGYGYGVKFPYACETGTL